MKSLFLSLLCLCASLTTAAQEHFHIEGSLTRDSLRFAPQRITKLYLARQHAGENLLIDSTIVSQGRFAFSGVVPPQPEMYFITGFDNGSIPVFLEAGTTTILPFDGHFPTGARLRGTPNNDVLFAYATLVDSLIRVNRAALTKLETQTPAHIKQSPTAYRPYQDAMFFGNTMRLRTAALRFVAQHSDALAALYMARYELFHLFAPESVENTLLSALAPQLHTHPLYQEMHNLALAAQMKEGALAPNLFGKTTEGKALSLTELRGKYVLIDFWASWCGPCRREFPWMKKLLSESESYNNFALFSFSLDKVSQEWTDCIAKNQLTHPNWLHLSDLKGWESTAVKLMGVKSVPRTVLLSPEGKIIALDLRGEAMYQRIMRIVRGEESSPLVAAPSTPAQTPSLTAAALQSRPLTTQEQAFLQAYRAIGSTQQAPHAAQTLAQKASQLQYLIDHPEASLTPLLLRTDFLPLFDQNYAENLLRCVSPTLYASEDYRELYNAVRSKDLKIGAPLPKLRFSLADGQQVQLDDLKGKFVLLNYWTPNDSLSMAEMTQLKAIHQRALQKQAPFVLLSISLDTDATAWQAALSKLPTTAHQWLHASDHLGLASPNAQLLHLQSPAKNILLNPEGQVLSFTLTGEQMREQLFRLFEGDNRFETIDDKGSLKP